MNQELVKVLQTSEDPKELLRVAGQLAGSEDPSDHEALLKSLGSETFLLRLNTKEEYYGDTRRLRVGRILDVLAKNRAPAARNTIVALTTNAIFIKEEGRIDLLVKATATVRPATPELVSFWDKHSSPDDASTPLVIDALIDNGSKPALELLEKKMADSKLDDEDKIIWMRTYLLEHRNQAALLQTCEHMLSTTLPVKLRPALVEAVFDYRPGEWYTPAEAYNPPPLESYSTSARTQMRSLGKYALEHVQLTAAQKEAVNSMLKALEGRQN